MGNGRWPERVNDHRKREDGCNAMYLEDHQGVDCIKCKNGMK